MKSLILLPLGALALLFTNGCATATAYTDPTNDKTAVVSLNKINVQDWSSASKQMIDSLLSSGVLEKAPRNPAIFAVDRIVNKTSDANLDTDMLTKNIRISLNHTGRVLTTTTYGNHAESHIAQDVQAKNDFLNGDSSHAADHSPDFTLSGKIIEDIARDGNTKQVTYIFQLTLTDTHSGLGVWEDSKPIQKTGTRGALGF